MSDIENYESLEGYETLIEYEGYETPAERSLAYIEENRQEHLREREDSSEAAEAYAEMLADERVYGDEPNYEGPDALIERLHNKLRKIFADYEKKRDETLPGTIDDLERKRDEALVKYERRLDEAMDDRAQEALDESFAYWERWGDEGNDLAGADLTNADLSDRDWSHRDMRGANLFKANLFNTNLAGANLAGANLEGAILSGANLSGTILRFSNLHKADLTGADLTGAVLTGATMPDGTIHD